MAKLSSKQIQGRTIEILERSPGEPHSREGDGNLWLCVMLANTDISESMTMARIAVQKH